MNKILGSIILEKILQIVIEKDLLNKLVSNLKEGKIINHNAPFIKKASKYLKIFALFLLISLVSITAVIVYLAYLLFTHVFN